MRLHAHYGTGGQGHVYQGRFKSFPVQDDEYFLLVCRYVERNALRAGPVRRAEDWTWGSLNRWLEEPEREPRLLSAWPIARSPQWVERVNKPLTATELKAVRTSVNAAGAESLDWVACGRRPGMAQPAAMYRRENGLVAKSSGRNDSP